MDGTVLVGLMGAFATQLVGFLIAVTMYGTVLVGPRRS